MLSLLMLYHGSLVNDTLVDTCDLYILLCAFHLLPSQCSHQFIINTTAAAVCSFVVDIFWHFWPALVVLYLPPAEDTLLSLYA